MLTALSLAIYRLINEIFIMGDDIDRQLFNQFSLTVRQYHMLNWLDRRGPMGLSELAQLMLCDKSNVTSITRRLITAQLIEKLPHSDRRFTTVALTAAGKQLHDEAEAALQQSIEERFATLPDFMILHQQLLQVHSSLKDYLLHRPES